MSDSTDTQTMFTRWRFLMEARKHASEQAEGQGHRWHLYLQLLLAGLIGVFILCGVEFHLNELFFVAGGTALLMLVSYVHSILFLGYYAIYCKEWRRADELQKELDEIRQTPSSAKLTDADHRRLLRRIPEGEKRLAACLAVAPGDAFGAINTNEAMTQWYRETLELIRSEYLSIADHFTDLGEFGANGVEGTDDQVSTLLQRLRDVAKENHHGI